MGVYDDSHQDDDDDKSLKKTKKTNDSHTKLRQDCDKAKTDDDEGEKPTHVCEICDKKFDSDKALGGHKSLHLRAQRKEKEKGENKGNNKLISNEKFSCCICGKDFPSKHSLYGHMAWHSDRNWKGIHPPLSSPSHHEPTSFYIAEECAYSEDKNIIAAQTLMALSRDTWPSGEYPPQLPSKKNINGASNSTRIEDIPSTSGVIDHANATQVFKKKRKLIVILKNPYLESKDEKRDPYQGNM